MKNSYHNERQKIIVGLDIGTSKVVAIAGKADHSGETEVVGIGRCDSGGLNKGAIIDIETTARAINKAIANMEMMAPCGEVQVVYTGLTGDHVKNRQIEQTIELDDTEISPDDIGHALDPTQLETIDLDRERILHIVPQEYILDGRRGIKEPLGMLGSRLEAKTQVFTCDEHIARNLERCMQSCELDVKGIALNQVAAGDAVLTQSEKEDGVCLIDMGAGTSDIAIFIGGTLKYTAMMPLGGHEVSNDIAAIFHISRLEAEQVKLQYGCLMPGYVSGDKVAKIARRAGKPAWHLDRYRLAEVIEARYTELLLLLKQLLHNSGYDSRIAAGIVLTGGAIGMSGMKGMAEDIFDNRARIAAPTTMNGLNHIVANPSYAAGIGILMQGIEDNRRNCRRYGRLGLLRQLQGWAGKYF